MSISKRAKALQANPSAIMTGHALCSKDPYELSNPKGYLNFGTAENHIMNDLLLTKINQKVTLTKEHIQYNQLNGIEEVRNSVANFLQKYLGLKNPNPENIVIQTGVSALCESLSFSLFDKDDVILIPAPYYTGFEHDFTKRFGCKFLKVQMNPEDNFSLDINPFKEAIKNVENKDKIKAILITGPNNPTGEVLNEEFIDDIIKFSKKNNLELISDEIYALSNHLGMKHVSLYQKAIDNNVKAHFLYGMAKDFALAGLKVGFYLSNDLELLESLKNVSYFHPVSTQTQLLVKNIFDDDKFLEHYIPLNQKRLNQIATLITHQLPMFSFIPGDSGLFMLLDLTKWCKDFEKEEKVFRTLLNEYKINLTPAIELGLDKPGYFRVCFARPKQDILEFIMRMRNFYENES